MLEKSLMNLTFSLSGVNANPGVAPGPFVVTW